jgi:Type I phosphodiesterase / nucleotide pyrophosphatase
MANRLHAMHGKGTIGSVCGRHLSRDSVVGGILQDMKKYHHLILSPLILMVIAFLAYRWADALQRSLLAYTSPLAGTEIEMGEPRAPLTQRVVIVVVSGISYQQTIMEDMPIWQSLAGTGASAAVLNQPPAYWPTVWTTLLTGVSSDLNDSSVLDPSVSPVRPIVLDNLLAAAADAGLRTAVAGSPERAPLLPAELADVSYFTHDTGVVADAQVVQTTLGLLADPQYHLIIVHLNQLAEIGRMEGIRGPAYRGALRQIDSHLRQIMRQLNQSQSVLLVTSDGALLEDGRPAGGETYPPTLPFVMAGQHTIVGEYSPIQLVDIAPTVAVLLGTRLPAADQGSPLFDMLRTDQETLVQAKLQLAAQKVSLAEAYVAATDQPVPNETVRHDLATAQQSLQMGNRAGALELAGLVSQESLAAMHSVKEARIGAERTSRLAPVAVAAVVPLLFFWVKRPSRALLSLVGALVALGIFYGLHRLQGYSFSLTDTLNWGGLFAPSVVRDALVGLAAGGLLVMAGLLSGEQHRWLASVSVAYDYALFTCYLSAVPILFAYWYHGAWISWYLPELNMVVLHALALRQSGIVAGASVIVPWLIGLTVWAVGRRQPRATDRLARAWDPIAHLRSPRGVRGRR